MLAPQAYSDRLDDWIDSPKTHELCQGYYQEQPVPFPGKSAAFLKQQPLTIESDHSTVKLEGDSTLTGHVHLLEGNRQLFADKAIIHRKEKEIDSIFVEGHVKLTEPGIRVTGSEGEYLPTQNTQTLEAAQYRLYEQHARGTAKRITVVDREKMSLDEASYTTCNPHQNDWLLRGKKIKLDKKTGRGKAYHTRLYVKDVPVFYFPYVDFPIDDRRQTGFLYPSFGVTNRSGLELGIPYYWNLAPNYDATLTPRVFSKRGVEMQGKFRYLTASSEGVIEGAFLPNDRAYHHFQSESRTNHPSMLNNDPRIRALDKNNNRSALRLQHQTQFNPNWSANLHYQRVHDDNYFMDFGSTIGLADTFHLLQQFSLYHQSSHWKAQARVQQYQTLHPFSGPITENIYRRLPQIEFQNTYDLPLRLEWAMNGEYSHFLHKNNPFTGASFTTGDRFHLRPALSLPLLSAGAYLTPRIQLNFLSYSLHRDPQATYQRHNPSQLIPMLDVNSGLVFERNVQFKQASYIQTLEPRLYYLYVPYRNQSELPNFDTNNPGFSYNQLYWDNRFSGLDRLGDANQLTAGITSRFFQEKTGLEKANVSLGQIFYFKKPRVTSCKANDSFCRQREIPHPNRRKSAMVGTVRYLLTQFWSLSANLEWDTYDKRANKKSASIHYQPNAYSVVNLGYQYLRNNYILSTQNAQPERLNQIDFSSAYTLNQRWRLLGRWHYDIHKHRSNDIAIGVEQQSCCTAVRLFVSHFLRPYDETSPNPRKYTNAIYLQFIFKGLGGVGHTKMDHVLKHAIPNYQWHSRSF